MLVVWWDFLEKVDLDIIIGYNIVNFDFFYFFDRVKYFKVYNFEYWFCMYVKLVVKEINFFSKQMGNCDMKVININGCFQFDLF